MLTGEIFPAFPGVEKRRTVEQRNTDPSVRMFSNPPDAPPQFDYFYDEKAGEGVTIYVLDTGFNLNHVVGILFSLYYFFNPITD